MGTSSISAPPSGSKAAFLQLEPVGPGCAPGARKRRGSSDTRSCNQAPWPSPSWCGSRTSITKLGPADPLPQTPEVPRVRTDGGMASREAEVGDVPNLCTWGRRGQRAFRKAYPTRCSPSCLPPRHLASRPSGPPRRRVTGPRGSQGRRQRRDGPSHDEDRGAQGFARRIGGVILA